MKKILLCFLSISMFGTMYANATWYQNETFDAVKPIAVLVQPEQSDVLTVTDNVLFQDGSFKISPNPSKNKLNVKLPASSENMTLEVFDVLGKRIHKSTITQLEASVDVSTWKSGIYLVKVSNEKESQTKRFIKQ